MDIRQSTSAYEAWVRVHARLVPADLAAKHTAMAGDPFSFLRATFYRWAELVPKLCPSEMDAPRILGVGDLHIENYGTWRDAEGRLIWGINDFDEAYPLPYTNDLIRLATSGWLAAKLGRIRLAPARIGAAIMEGYAGELAIGGRPYVLSERHRWLRDTVTSQRRDPTRYWEKLCAYPPLARVPSAVKTMLKQALPELSEPPRIVHRLAGLGSLGRERYTAIAELRGGKIAREAKSLFPSAWAWANGRPGETALYYDAVLNQSIRSADPFLRVVPGWVIRRLSPYCSRIDLNELAEERHEARLLRAMGRELANIHVGDKKAATAIQRDLAQRNPRWLRQATENMLEATLADWREWARETDRV
ncbi:MAG TPA: DUF2252 family protein [Candidatus Limnocylindria bacterium]|jgi:uncharacterized protein (DUF2252 family)|nr:DUF2252 family protein [Candidatus Limnocylindria bacterium]